MKKTTTTEKYEKGQLVERIIVEEVYDNCDQIVPISYSPTTPAPRWQQNPIYGPTAICSTTSSKTISLDEEIEKKRKDYQRLYQRFYQK
jgi:hypothetical protein